MEREVLRGEGKGGGGTMRGPARGRPATRPGGRSPDSEDTTRKGWEKLDPLNELQLEVEESDGAGLLEPIKPSKGQGATAARVRR